MQSMKRALPFPLLTFNFDRIVFRAEYDRYALRGKHRDDIFLAITYSFIDRRYKANNVMNRSPTARLRNYIFKLIASVTANNLQQSGRLKFCSSKLYYAI